MKRLFLGITVALVVVGVTLVRLAPITRGHAGRHRSILREPGHAPVRCARRNVDEPLLGDHQRGRLADRGAGQLERRPRALRPRLCGHGRPARRAESEQHFRAHLIAKGYAWAASSYRANGYVPGTGAEDTYDLLKIFKQVVSKDAKKGNFKRVYLYGVSMGGHVVGHMIEKWRNSFAGALPVCGVMGDNELFDFFQDMYLVAETLVGNTPIVPTPADYYTNPAQGVAGDAHASRHVVPDRPHDRGNCASSRSSRISPGATGRSTTRALSGLPVEPSRSTSARPSPAPAVKTSIPSTSSTPTRRCRRKSSSSTTP